MDKADEKLLVRFFMDRQKNEFRSNAEGRDIFDEVECVSIRVPGSRDEVVHIVNDELRARFKPLYKSWKSDEAAPVTGTPLDQWPAASVDFINEMRLFNVRTVEQLAELSDGTVAGNPGWVTMRTKAQAFIDQAKDGGTVARIALENETLRQQVATLSEQMAAILAAQQPSPRRGRAAKPADLTDDEVGQIMHSDAA